MGGFNSLVSAARDGLTEIESQINESLAVYTSEESKQKEFEEQEQEQDDQRSAGAQSSDGWEKCSDPDDNEEEKQVKECSPRMSFVDLKSAAVEDTDESSEPKVPTELATAQKTIMNMEKVIRNLKEKLLEKTEEAEKYRKENFELKKLVDLQKNPGQSEEGQASTG